MPTDHERIQTLKKRIAAKKAKLASLPAIQRLTTAIQADEAKAEKLEVLEAKRKADQKRRDDTRAKILIGAGVSKLPRAPFFSILHEVLAALAKPEREWLKNWLENRAIDLEDVTDSANREAAQHTTLPSDPIGDIFKRIFTNLGGGTYELLHAEMLAQAGDEDKASLESWFATLAVRQIRSAQSSSACASTVLVASS